MSQVNVANPTLQHAHFSYRLPHIQTLRTLKIPAGGQVKFPEDLTGNDLQSVLDQLARYGAVPQSEVGAIVRPKTLIFDVSATPIKVDKIEEGLGRDEDARQEVAGQKMEEAGLGAFKTTQDNLLAAKAPGKLTETSVEIVEVNDRGKVEGGVNVEFVTSTKPERRAGRKRTEEKA